VSALDAACRVLFEVAELRRIETEIAQALGEITGSGAEKER